MLPWKLFKTAFIYLLVVILSAEARIFRYQLQSNGYYELTVDNKVWLTSGPTFLRANRKVYSNADSSLQISNIRTDSGQDILGPWNSTMINYTLADDPSTTMQASIIYYSTLNMIRFQQNFPNGASGCAVPNEYQSVITGFPTFKVATYDEKKIGFLSYGGQMTGDVEKVYGEWDIGVTYINDGLSGGPIILFNTNGSTIVISSMTNFMAASMYHDKLAQGTVSYGIMSGVDSIPSNYTLDYMVYYSDDGIKLGMQQWGSILTKFYGKKSEYRQNDFNINYLSYWTDNGAYYYWHTEDEKDYQTTIIDVMKSSKSNGIPYRSIQYDSWWYGAQRNARQGCFNWNGNEPSKIFPNTSEYVFAQTGLPVTAHNKYWDHSVVYAVQNGGDYDFIIDQFTGKSLPIEGRFWDDLFANATKWGLTTYEQDWLNHQLLDFTPLMTNITLGRDWLTQMATAAKKHNLTIQYCMTLPRHVLQSLEFDVVTQIRVTDDYATNWNYDAQQWRVGVTSHFASALGTAPFKDVFWTSNIEPGNHYGKNATEISPEINAAVSVLTTGPVGPGDRIDKMNKTLIMRACMDDGLLLKPSVPITAIDSQIYARALGKEYGPEGEVWSTYSMISDIPFGIIFVADMKNSYNITVDNMKIPYWNNNYFWKDGDTNLYPFNGLQPNVALTVNESCSIQNFCLYHITPVFSIGEWNASLIGEISKWVPVSPQRFKNISFKASSITADIVGTLNETIEVYFALNKQLFTAKCVISNTLTATIIVNLSNGVSITCS